MRSSIVGIALNPFYILNSFVGVIGCLTLNSVFITCYMGGNTILNFALIVVGVVQVLMPHGDMMGLYFYGPGCLLDQIIVCQSWPLLRCIARADRASRGAPDAPPPPDARQPAALELSSVQQTTGPATVAAPALSGAAPSIRALGALGDECTCPITMQPMTDPVVAADGHSYDRAAIEGWFRSGHRTSPMTGQTLRSQALIPNHRLRQMIESIDEHERRPQPAIVSGRVVASAPPDVVESV